MIPSTHPAPDGVERRPVTVLFCDLVGSTSLGEHLDPEAYHSVIRHYYDAVDHVVRTHLGRTEKFIGDAVMAVFGLDVVREDDALLALEAALGALAAVEALETEVDLPGPDRLAARCGVHTGPVLVSSGMTPDTLIGGDVVNVAARLQGLAEPGQVLVSDTAARWAGPAARCGELTSRQVAGRRAAVDVRPLLTVDRRGLRRRHRVLVGRAEELRVLQAVIHRSLVRRRPAVCAVIGAPGVGKTRLVAEALAQLGPATVVVEQAQRQENSPHLHGWLGDHLAGTGAPWPSSGPPLVDELEQLARPGGAVAFLDDAQRAEPELAERVSWLLAVARHVPLVVVLAGRPDGPGAATGPWWQLTGRDVTVVWLDDLDEAASRELISQVRRSLEPDVVGHAAISDRQLISHAGGNPLFLEELLAAPRQRSDDLPPTVEAVAAGRLSRLSRTEFSVVQLAAVLGPRFTVEELLALGSLRGVDGPSLGPVLESLWRQEILREPAGAARHWAFTSDVLRMAAYASVPRQQRVTLHLEVAGWAERPPEGATINAETRTGHLERAAQELEVLRPGDPGLAALLGEVDEALQELTLEALDRGDVVTAEERGRRRLAVARTEVATDAALLLLADVLVLRGEGDAARAALEQTGAPAQTIGGRVAHMAMAALDPDDPDRARDAADQVRSALAATGLDLGSRRSLAVLGLVADLRGRAEEAVLHLGLALGESQFDGRPWERSVLAARLARAYGRGPLPYPEAAAAVDALRAQEPQGPGGPELAAWSLALRQLAGSEVPASGRSGPIERAATMVAADAAILSGRWDQAEELLRSVGLPTGDLAIGGRLAFVLATSGRQSEAAGVVSITRLVAPALGHPRVSRGALFLRLAQAEVLAERGLTDHATGTALGAWSVAAQTDDLAVAAVVAGTIGRLSRPLGQAGSLHWERMAAHLARTKGLQLWTSDPSRSSAASRP